MAEIEIRELSGGYPAVRELLSVCFGFEWPDGVADPYNRLFEPGRSVAAYDGAELVGHAGTLSLEQRVPGGEVATAGAVLGGVLATHRRRGIMERIMRRQLADIYEAGAEPIASCTTSGAQTYRRCGYGPASQQIAVDIPRGVRLPAVDGIDEVRLRYTAPETVRGVCADIHDAATAGRPGTFRYTGRWRRQLENDPSTMSPGWRSPVRCVLAQRGETVTGFAYYRGETAGDGDGAVEVDRIHATDLASYAALWRLLLNQDLMATTRHRGLAVDDPLLVLLSGQELTAMHLSDYRIRLVDVGRGLAARTYAAEVDVVLDVRDAACPWNARRWRLSGGPDGATCEPTSDPADLALDVCDLGAAYLGGLSLVSLAGAGLVEEVGKGALDQASLAMGHAVPPWRDTLI